MSYKNFLKDQKTGINSRVFFFFGEEDFLMNWAIEKLIESNINDDLREYNVTELDGNSVDINEMISAASGISIFPGGRIICIRNYRALHRKDSVPTEELDRLISYIKNLSDIKVNKDTILLFYLDSMYSSDLTRFAKKMMKIAASYKFERIDKTDLRGFIKKRIKASGKYLSNNLIEYIIDVSGYCLRESEYGLDRLDKDINKLINASADEEITRELIDDLILGDDERFVFDFIDALMANNKKRAFMLLMNILKDNPDAAMSLAGLLIKQLEFMFDSLELEAEGYSVSKMAKVIGINEYRLKKAYASARRLGENKIRNMLIYLYNADKNLKTAGMNMELSLQMFVLNL